MTGCFELHFIHLLNMPSGFEHEERNSSAAAEMDGFFVTERPSKLLLGFQSEFGELRRRLVTRDDLAIGEDDRRGTLNTDQLA